ncbi:hypothetical protein BATR1942_17485 [Bacillus atrophaeus 1942]|uniref:Transposase n=1 Tax=Bacillus atrophaeus (strain 1942) TaxID=720555 RepID=A0ABM5M2L1_BACA1|nr:hypothetical protein BATR1942_17485 [Bacillus atrophaeus 1942]EIM11362.1 hypothetical protein UY9_07325 [Bacillus atrophaeus C89]
MRAQAKLIQAHEAWRLFNPAFDVVRIFQLANLDDTKPRRIKHFNF